MLYLICQNCRHFSRRDSTCWETGRRVQPCGGCVRAHTARYRADLYISQPEDAAPGQNEKNSAKFG